MLNDAIYYSRRENDERVAARQASDARVRQIHAMLADRYGQLARRALAELPEIDTRLPRSAAVDTLPNRPGLARRFR